MKSLTITTIQRTPFPGALAALAASYKRDEQRENVKTTKPTPKPLTKRIAYLICDNGVDGREPTSILSAYWTEAERTAALEKDPSKAWRHTEERIVTVESTYAQALAKLDGVDRLCVGTPCVA